MGWWARLADISCDAAFEFCLHVDFDMACEVMEFC